MNYRQPIGRAISRLAIPMVSYMILSSTTLVNADTTQFGQALPFQDISQSYAQNQIVDLYNRNIVTGIGNQLFEPKRSVTRAESITMLDRLFHIQPVNAAVAAFSDVPSNTWEYPWVQAGVSLQLVNGTGNNTYEPNRQVSRQEAAVMFAHVLQGISKQPSNGTIQQTFADQASIAPWALPSVQEIQALGIMNGDTQGDFRPQDPLTREEIAVVFENMLKYIPNIQQPVITTTPSITTSTSATTSTMQTAKSSLIQLGWQYGQTTTQFVASVQTSNTVNTLSPPGFFLGPDGQISKSGSFDPALVTWAHQTEKQVWPLVGNHFDKNTTHKVLSDLNLRNNLVQQLASFAAQYQLDGLNIDFEGMDPNDKVNFTAFIQALAVQLHNQNKLLSVDIPPDLGTDWSATFDDQALGQSADYLILMGYDEHWENDSIAGSVSSLPWLQNAVNKLLQQVPPGKIILGLPFYTRDWYLGNGKLPDELSLAEEANTIKQANTSMVWDATKGQYIATYTKNGINHSIWVEDGRSLSLKEQFALQKQLAGFAYWYIGGETQDIWQSLSNVYNFYTSFADNARTSGI